MRVGMGFDVHRFVEGRPLILGGVEINYEKGLAGHSDADVLVHAIIDALLGAASLGDIGRHFPDSDNQYKDISSLELLVDTFDMIKDVGYKVINVDATLVLEEPRLSNHKTAMEEIISACLHMSENDVNIKATTTEGLGFTGRGEGIAAHAVVCIGDM